MTRYSQNCRGFTLVELLVVITIIGVLAGLAAGGMWIVQARVRETMTKAQLSQMDLALEAYKNEFGEYPPPLNDPEAVMRHARSRWKRASLNYDMILMAAGLALDGDLTDGEEKIAANNDRIALTLTFWLGGLYVNGSYRGFNADLENPLVSGNQWKEPLFDFSEKNTEALEADKPHLRFFAIDKKPVVYFRSTANGEYHNPNPPGEPNRFLCGWREHGDAVPYAKSQDANGNVVWHGARKYQLIHPGRDGKFSEVPDRLAAPVPIVHRDHENTLDYEDYDNIVNFTDTATLKGALNQ